MMLNNKCNNTSFSSVFNFSVILSLRGACGFLHNLVILLLLVMFFPFYACSAEISEEQEINDINFCVLIVPDIQNYTDTDDRFCYLDSIAGYYKANKNYFDAVLQVGDLTNNNLVSQYRNAYDHFFSKFDESDQLVFCLGNHDYGDHGRSDIRMSNIPDYMMPPCDIRMKGSKWDNYVRYIELGGMKYGALVLEFCTRNDVLEWANDVISADSETPYIILTHVFLDQNGVMFDAANPLVNNKGSSHKMYKMGDDYKNDSREIFDKIIYNNTNVKLVVCGHCLTPSFINVYSENNVAGMPVHMIEVNYQHYTEGGQGYVGILDVKGETYRIRSYSTYDNKYGSRDISFGSIN